MKKATATLALLAVSTGLVACGPTYHDRDGRYEHKNGYVDYQDSPKEAMANYYFYRMDTDHNGYISRTEHETFAAGMFTRADTNNDNFLTFREIMAHKHGEWDDFRANFYDRPGAVYEGDRFYPYGKEAPTLTPNEPYKANRGKTDRSWRNYEIRDDNY